MGLAKLPPTIYFLCTFKVVALTTSMVLEQFEIHVSTHAVATMLALLVGKVMQITPFPYTLAFCPPLLDKGHPYNAQYLLRVRNRPSPWH